VAETASVSLVAAMCPFMLQKCKRKRQWQSHENCFGFGSEITVAILKQEPFEYQRFNDLVTCFWMAKN
jgi:hypothetical protein